MDANQENSNAIGPRPKAGSGGLMALATPTMVTFSAIAVRQFTDAWMVGRLGIHEFAAIVPVQMVLFILISFGGGLASALNTCASQAQAAAEDNREAGRHLWQSIWLALIFGALATSLGNFAPAIMAVFNHAQPVYALEVEYLRIALWATIPQFVALALSNFFFAIRKPGIPMWFGLAHTLLNIAANAVFIFGIEGVVPKMGMAGAAVGTIIASTFLCVCLLGYFFFSRALNEFRSRRPALSVSRMREHLKIGPINGFLDVADILCWNVAILVLIGGFGTAHLAAANILVLLIDLILFPADGIIVAVTTVVGEHVGAKRYAAARREVRRALRFTFFFASGIVAITFFASPLIFQALRPEPEVWEIGKRCILLFPLIVLFSNWFYITDAGLNGAGDAVVPFLVVLGANLLFIGIGGFGGRIVYFELGSYFIWTCMMVNRGVIAVILATRWTSGAWKKARFELAADARG